MTNPFKFLPVDDVNAELKKRGGKFTRVTFRKTNGELASRVGRGKTHSRRVDHETADAESVARSIAATDALRRAGNVFLDYPSKERKDGKRGFSFNTGRVVAIGEVNKDEHPDEII